MSVIQQIEVPPAAKSSTIVAAYMQDGPQYLAKANALQVATSAQHQAAIDLLQDIANRKKTVEDERTKITNPLHTAWKNTNTFFASLLLPFTNVDTIVRAKVIAYEKLEKDKAAAAQKLLDDAAAREREKLAAQQRETERVAKEKADQLKADADRKKLEADQAIERAQLAAEAGDTTVAADAQAQAVEANKEAAKLERKAETIVATAVQRSETLGMRAASIVAPIVQAPNLKAGGKIDRRVWKYEILDASKIDRKFLCIDEQKIGALVKSMKGEAAELIGEPGCIKVWDEPDLSIRAKP